MPCSAQQQMANALLSTSPRTNAGKAREFHQVRRAAALERPARGFPRVDRAVRSAAGIHRRGRATNGDGWVDAKGMFMAAAAAGPVFRLLGKKDLGTSAFPPIETALVDGDVAFRHHSGGHTDVPLGHARRFTFRFAHFTKRFSIPANRPASAFVPAHIDWPRECATPAQEVSPWHLQRPSVRSARFP